MNINLTPAKLAEFEALTLQYGSHDSFSDGHCAMEVVSWLADEGFTDAPTCASPIVRRYTIALNDRWDDETRQTLKPYLLRMVGTGSDGLEGARERVLLEHAGRKILGPWLRLAGLDMEAKRIEDATDIATLRQAVRSAADAAWEARRTARDGLGARVRAELDKRDLKTVVAAADSADAAAVGAAAFAVDVAIDAVVATAIDADAAIDAVVATAIDAAIDADAVVATAIDAVVATAIDADAAIDAVADVAAEGYSAQWDAAYRAARAHYDQHPLPIAAKLAEIAAAQDGIALELLDRLIDPETE